MKNSTKSKPTSTKEISPASKKTAIAKKTKDVKPKKNAKDLVKNESVQLNDDDLPSSSLLEKLFNDRYDESNEKPTKSKQKKNESTKPKKAKKEASTDEPKPSKKKPTNDKAKSSSSSTNSDKQSDKASNKSNKSQINGSKKPTNKSKDEKKSSSSSFSSKNSNSSAKNGGSSKQKEDKKLAALLQLQDIRPRGPRLASLNASCKMQLLYESEREKLNEGPVENADTDETDASTEELDPVESVVNNFINSNNDSKSPIDDLLTEEEQNAESDDEPPAVVESRPEKRNERDLLNESINSVINSINNSIKMKDKQKSSIKKKKKPNKDDEVSLNDDDANSELSTSKLKPPISKPPKSKQASKDKKDKKDSKSSKTKDKDSQSDKPSSKKENGGKKEKSPKNESKNESKSELKGESKTEPSSKSTSKENSKSSKKAKKKKPLVKENERKRKLDIDDSVELIDTRSTKRLASLNASAIMAASYQDEKPLVPVQAGSKQSTSAPPSPKPNYQEHVEVIHKTTTVMNDGVTETIEKIKKITHVSGKIRERLLAIEMMENENTDDDLISNNCIIEEPETEDEHDEEQAKSVGKSVLQKKINASNASSKQQKTSSEVIEEVNCSEPHTPSKSSGYNSNYASTGNRDATVTSLTKTTKVKINKKKHNEKTTVEKYKYEVHGAYNPLNSNHLSIENIRTPNSSGSPFDKTTNLDHQTATAGLNGQQATTTQFIPLQANPYALHSTPGYCIYPNAGAALQLAYQQQLQQAQQQLQQAAQQQAQLAYLAQQQLYQPQTAQFSAVPNLQATTAAAEQPSNVNLSSSNNATNHNSSNSTSSSNFTKKSYKSAFNAVPHNSATSSSTSTSTSVTTSTSKSSKTTDSSSTSKANGKFFPLNF